MASPSSPLRPTPWQQLFLSPVHHQGLQLSPAHMESMRSSPASKASSRRSVAERWSDAPSTRSGSPRRSAAAPTHSTSASASASGLHDRVTHHSCAACSRVAFLRDTVPSHDLSTTIVRLEGELARSRQESAALSEQCVFLEKCNAQAASDLAAAYARIEVLEDSVRASLTRMMELRLRSEATAVGVTNEDSIQRFVTSDVRRRVDEALADLKSASSSANRPVAAASSPVSTSGRGQSPTAAAGAASGAHATDEQAGSSGGDRSGASVTGDANGNAGGDDGARSRGEVEPSVRRSPGQPVGFNGLMDSLMGGILGNANAAKEKTDEELAHLAQRLQSESAARQRAETELASVTQRLTAAEEAYQYLQSQLSPYRLNYSQHKVSVEPVRDASSRLADWNAAICRAFIESFADDARKHFGYLPLHIANRVKEWQAEVRTFASSEDVVDPGTIRLRTLIKERT